MKQHRPTVAEINLSHLLKNFSTLQKMVAPQAFFCPMVKADAYGHGAAAVTRALRANGAHQVGVALIEEGIELRQAGDQGRVLVFGLFDDTESAEALLHSNLTPVVSDWPQLEALRSASRNGRRVRVHLKFNTGMNRLGFGVDEARRLRHWLEQEKWCELEGICTHLLRGDDAASAEGDSSAQFEQLAKAVAEFSGLSFHVHALNSGAMVAMSVERKKPPIDTLGARPGIALYGAQPTTDPRLRCELHAVLTLKSRVAMVSKLKTGERVSYGGTWKARRESLIGVVPVGYADGFPRLLSNKGSVLCRGQRVPVTGTVCMDYFMIDLTDVVKAGDEAILGEELVLIGAQGNQRISAEEVADHAATISYEVFTGIGTRVPRRYTQSEAR